MSNNNKKANMSIPTQSIPFLLQKEISRALDIPDGPYDMRYKEGRKAGLEWALGLVEKMTQPIPNIQEGGRLYREVRANEKLPGQGIQVFAFETEAPVIRGTLEWSRDDRFYGLWFKTRGNTEEIKERSSRLRDIFWLEEYTPETSSPASEAGMSQEDFDRLTPDDPELPETENPQASYWFEKARETLVERNDFKAQAGRLSQEIQEYRKAMIAATNDMSCPLWFRRAINKLLDKYPQP